MDRSISKKTRTELLGAVADPKNVLATLMDLRRHDRTRGQLERFEGAAEATCLLLVLTPDNARPAALDSIGDDRLVWASFSALDQAIDEMLGDKPIRASAYIGLVRNDVRNKRPGCPTDCPASRPLSIINRSSSSSAHAARIVTAPAED